MTTSTLSCRPRWGTRRRPERPTIGGAIAKVAADLGKPLMPWQREVADIVGEYDPVTMRLYYTECGLTVPRQSGKSTFVLAKSVHRCSHTSFFGARQRVVYTAQTRAKAREKWEEDYLGDLEADTAGARKYGAKANKTTGNEHIRFTNRSRFGIEANTEKAGHGGTLDEAYIDEAFSQVDSRLEQAFGPAMITRKNKQLFWISTAGWLLHSPYLEAKVLVGRAAAEADTGLGLAYFEWSAVEDCDPGDPAVWWGCMPALGHTITEADIRLEYEKAVRENKINDFKRAYLNLWVPKDEPDEALIDPKHWASLTDVASKAVDDLGFAVDVQPDNLSACVAVSGRRPDGLKHVEILKHADGTDWLYDYVEAVWHANRIPFVVDPDGPAGAFVDELERRGVHFTKVSSKEYAAACSTFVTEVKAERPEGPPGRIRHQGWAALSIAIGSAQKRAVGDGPWCWGRKKVTADISPLVAVTLALHGHLHPVRPLAGHFFSL